MMKACINCPRDLLQRVKTLCLSVSCLRFSWPWWMGVGIIIVPFMESLRLVEYLSGFIVLIGSYWFFQKIRCLTGALILMVSGVLWGTLWGQAALDMRLPKALIKQEVWATGSVQGLPQQREHAQRFKFKIFTLEAHAKSYPFHGDVLLNWYKPYPQLQPGQRWRLKLRLKPAHGTLNPGGFNYEQWLFSQRIRATGYVREPQSAELLNPAVWNFNFDHYRERIRLFIETQTLDYGGVINALAVGVRTGITAAQWQVFRDTGTAHLIAISGLHIGMVAALAYALGLWLWRYTLLARSHYPAQNVGRISALLMATLYAALAGFALPTQRALLMLLAYTFLYALRRNPSVLFTLGLVLLMVLLFDPLAPLGAGFWLSFSAVLAIALAMRKADLPASDEQALNTTLTRIENVKTVIKRRFAQWWKIQWAVFIGLLPLTLFMFQQVSMIMLLANLVAIPVIAMFVVPLILLALLALFLGQAAVSSLLLVLVDHVIGGLWPILQYMSELPFAIWAAPSPSIWVMFTSAIACLILLSQRLGRLRSFGLVGLLPLFVSSAPVRDAGEFTLHMLDVGQGLAMVLETRSHALLYDAGVKYKSGFDSGQTIVLPFVRQQRIAQLDMLVASHDNLDHTGGLAAVWSQHDQAQVFSSAAFYGRSQACEAGLSWSWDEVEFEFLSPEAGNRGSDNNHSCVLKVQSRFGSTLLTGDIEGATERALVDKYTDSIKGIDVLQVPHHGSKTSSGAGWLQTIQPTLAVVSSGYLNRFGHPHQDIVQRYSAQEIPLLNTADSGWIKIDFSSEGIHAIPWRSVYKRYWLSKD